MPRPIPAALLAAAACACLAFAAQEPAPPSDPQPVEIAGELWHLGPVRPAPGPVPERNEAWRELDCAACHPEIAREWSSTLHALAWIDPLYQASLVGLRRPEGCYACHAPQPVHGTGVGLRPEVREESRHRGIDCVVCHLGPEGEILGPWGIPTEAHRSVKGTSFLPEGESELCLSCHSTTIGPVIGLGRDFQRTEQHQKGKSCVACHMRPLERSVAIDPASGERSPVRPGRSHELQSTRDPAFLAQAFDLSAFERGGRSVLRLVNRCGHRVPGLEDRRLAFEIEVLDAAGLPLARTEFEIGKATFLAVDAGREVELEALGPALRVRAVHHSPGLDAPVEFLDLRLAVRRP